MPLLRLRLCRWWWWPLLHWCRLWLCRRCRLRGGWLLLLLLLRLWLLLLLGLLRSFRSLGILYLGVHGGDTGVCISVGRRGVGSDRIRGFFS